MSQTTTDTSTEENRTLDAIATRERWEAFVDRARAVVEECILTIDDDGLYTRGSDPANVCMVDLTLSPEGFESYESTEDEVGISLDRFTDVLAIADKEDPVRVALDAETRKFHVAGDGFEYTLAAINPDTIRDRPDIPDLDLPVECVVEGDRFARAVDGADMVSDHFSLGYEKPADEVYAAAEGDIDDVRFAWNEDELEALEPGDESVESFFSTGYMGDLADVLAGDPVTVTFGDEWPVLLEQSWADGAGECLYMQAPRIKSR